MAGTKNLMAYEPLETRNIDGKGPIMLKLVCLQISSLIGLFQKTCLSV